MATWIYSLYSDGWKEGDILYPPNYGRFIFNGSIYKYNARHKFKELFLGSDDGKTWYEVTVKDIFKDE